MASVSVPGVHSCGNLHHLLVLGALGPSLCHGGGLRAPFLFRRGVAGMVEHSRAISLSNTIPREAPTADPHLVPLL